MISIPFPFTIVYDKEVDICEWIGENSEHASLSKDYKSIEIDNEELAIYFRLKFGL